MGSGLGRDPQDSELTQLTWAPIGPRVNAWTDPWIVSGPTHELLEWTVWYSLIPMKPTSISIAAGQIRLVNAAWVNQGNISQVGYSPGPVPYVNSQTGVLPGFLEPFPFP